MRSSTIVLAVGLLAAPLATFTQPGTSLTAPLFPVAQAQTSDTINGRKLEPAPVPGITAPNVPPEERVAAPGSHTLAAGPANATPLSATPSGTLSDGGTQASESDRVASTPSEGGVTPNLSR